MTRIGLLFLWLLHFLPLPLLRQLGRLLGWALYRFGHERRTVTLTNLRWCFPDRSESDREALARGHFVCFAQTFLERGLLWWSSPARLKRLIEVRGLEHLAGAQPTLLLAPHFVGLDAGWTRLTLERPLASVYAKQKNPAFDAALFAGRSRFNAPMLVSRQDGLRRMVRELKAGTPFYYLPDMDFGPQDSIFVPFFGVPAATITGVPRLAALAGARVVPVLTRLTATGYRMEILPPWNDFPGDEVESDVRRVNAAIEDWVSEYPEQYFWAHKRFKTRPPGEPRFYNKVGKRL
jgi:KDO2-lipid IV(A) lauroyltransferase